MSFTRITVRADQMGGVPCIRGLRIPVATVVSMVADGMSDQEILAAYPDLEAEDIREAVRYAAEAVRERELPLAAAGAPLLGVVANGFKAGRRGGYGSYGYAYNYATTGTGPTTETGLTSASPNGAVTADEPVPTPQP
jgi:uncharacterized protein (DUF433 family)